MTAPPPALPHNEDSTIYVGKIVAAHGIAGAVRILSHTEPPENIGTYTPLLSQEGRAFNIIDARRGAKPSLVIARLDGVTTATQAEALIDTALYITRAQLPPSEPDSFYHADLIGLIAIDASGTEQGVVSAVYNFGGGDIIEIDDMLLPFTNDYILDIRLAARQIVIRTPTQK